MGNRDDLIAGARRCMEEKGYARTTARDIAEAAGTSLAAIGYHFGSKQDLLNAALLQANEIEIGDAIEAAMKASMSASSSAERFALIWEHIVNSLEGKRNIFTTSVENIAQVDRAPAVRKVFAPAQREAVVELATQYRQIDPTADDATATAVGELLYMLVNGLIIRWLIDDESVPSGEQLVSAFSALAVR